MTVFTEGKHPGDGLLSEATRSRSRDAITIVAGSGVISPMTVLGLITSGANAGKYEPSTNAAKVPDIGSQTAKAVNLYGGDATTADLEVAAIVRDAEVNGHALSFDASVNDATKRAAKATQLAAVGIIVRN